jgi:hypothetical protein
MTIQTFNERKQIVMNRQKDNINTENKKYSTDILDHLGCPNQPPESLLSACESLENEMSIVVRWPDEYSVPTLDLEVEFGFPNRIYEEKLVWPKELLLEDYPIYQPIVMEENQRVIAYASIIENSPGIYQIPYIDVDRYSRISAECSVPWHYRGHTFQVGIGHLLVIKAVEKISNISIKPGKIKTKAEHSRSRFIFKSLGFYNLKKQKNMTQSEGLLLEFNFN